MSSKQILLILRHAPFTNTNNKDSLDIALACAAFDLPISVLFMDEAILQITDITDTRVIDQKNLANTFKALPMYDINDCYIIREDIARFNINQQALVIPCQTLDSTQLASFIQKFDTVINL